MRLGEAANENGRKMGFREALVRRAQFTALGFVAWPLTGSLLCAALTGGPEPGQTAGAVATVLVPVVVTWRRDAERARRALRPYAIACGCAFLASLLLMRAVAAVAQP